MTARTPRQQAAVDKFTHALSTAIEDQCIERMSSEEMDDAFAAALGALSPHDVAAFWLPHDCAGQGGCAGDFGALPPEEAAPPASIVILPVVRVERAGVDLANQGHAAGRDDVIRLRRG